MDFEKFKRIIPDLIDKVKNKFSEENLEPSSTTNDEAKIVTRYKYLPNDQHFRNLHLYEKIWFLRGKFDYFHLTAGRSQSYADSSVEMLEEISEELETLACEQTTIEKFLWLYQLKFNVDHYYKQYVNDEFEGEDCFNYDFPDERNGDKMNVFDELWILRSLYDSAMESGNSEGIKSAKLWLKSIESSCFGEEVDAVKRIMARVKQQIKNKKIEHYDLEE